MKAKILIGLDVLKFVLLSFILLTSAAIRYLNINSRLTTDSLKIILLILLAFSTIPLNAFVNSASMSKHLNHDDFIFKIRRNKRSVITYPKLVKTLSFKMLDEMKRISFNFINTLYDSCTNVFGKSFKFLERLWMPFNLPAHLIKAFLTSSCGIYSSFGVLLRAFNSLKIVSLTSPSFSRIKSIFLTLDFISSTSLCKVLNSLRFFAGISVRAFIRRICHSKLINIEGYKAGPIAKFWNPFFISFVFISSLLLLSASVSAVKPIISELTIAPEAIIGENVTATVKCEGNVTQVTGDLSGATYATDLNFTKTNETYSLEISNGYLSVGNYILDVYCHGEGTSKSSGLFKVLPFKLTTAIVNISSQNYGNETVFVNDTVRLDVDVRKNNEIVSPDVNFTILLNETPVEFVANFSDNWIVSFTIANEGKYNLTVKATFDNVEARDSVLLDVIPKAVESVVVSPQIEVIETNVTENFTVDISAVEVVQQNETFSISISPLDITGLATAVGNITAETVPNETIAAAVPAPVNAISFDFEENRGNLPEDFYLRDGSDDVDSDKYGWTWLPISKEKYIGNNSLLINLTEFPTNQLIFSKTFSLNASFFEFSFYYKPFSTENLVQVGIEVLFEDGTSDDTWGILLTDKGLSELPENLPSNFNVTIADAENGWKKVTARNLADASSRKLRVFIANAASLLEGYVVIDDIKVFPAVG